MLHPSYSEIMKVVNSEVEPGDEPVVNSRYSIVLATATRARQIIERQSKEDPDIPIVSKPLSKAVSELYEGKIRILPETEELEESAAEEAEEVTTEDTLEEAGEAVEE